MKNLKLKNKNIIIIAGAVLGIILIGVIIFLLMPNGGSQEKELKAKMEELGKDFYENFYYKQVGTTDEERATFLKKYESLGIKVNLDNLARYSSDDSEELLKMFVNKKTNKECDKTNSQVVIYPQDPYKQTSYKIDVKLDCGFEEQK